MKCPGCGGPSDNGYNTERPPNPCWCDTCCDRYEALAQKLLDSGMNLFPSEKMRSDVEWVKKQLPKARAMLASIDTAGPFGDHGVGAHVLDLETQCEKLLKGHIEYLEARVAGMVGQQ